MNNKPEPVCDCTPEGDIARERHPTLHQEHCAIVKWWNSKKLACFHCNGTGKVLDYPNGPAGPCPSCEGRGKSIRSAISNAGWTP